MYKDQIGKENFLSANSDLILKSINGKINSLYSSTPLEKLGKYVPLFREYDTVFYQVYVVLGEGTTDLIEALRYYIAV